jgi:hypothetical protein
VVELRPEQGREPAEREWRMAEPMALLLVTTECRDGVAVRLGGTIVDGAVAALAQLGIAGVIATREQRHEPGDRSAMHVV